MASEKTSHEKRKNKREGAHVNKSITISSASESHSGSDSSVSTTKGKPNKGPNELN